MNQTLRDLLAAGRVSNLPTVWSNVFCGFFVTAHHLGIASPSWTRLALGLLTGSFLYVAGCFYNDYHDRAWDALHKPERAVPSGRLPSSALLLLIFIGVALGITGSSILGLTALLTTFLLLLFIWIYTLIHKKTLWGIIPMGLCRACLYFLGFACVRDIPVSSGHTATHLSSLLKSGSLFSVTLLGIGILFYIAGITAVARNEAKNTLSPLIKLVGTGCLLIPVLTHFRFSTESYPYLALVIFALVFLEARKALIKKQLGEFVSVSLAGLCIVDGLAYLSLSHPQPLNNILSFTIMIGLYISSRLLQRVAPAT